MEQHLLQIRDYQKESWNKFSPGWKKWDNLFMDFLKPQGDEIIRQINLKGDAYVLDIAAGTGEPGLTIASMLEEGRVVITDLAEDMVAIAKENAIFRGINNVETVACDVSELPFENNTFDAVSCRFGFMFFPDMQVAANEMVRVLKPGRKLATSVWNGPEFNFWITAIMGSISRHMTLPAPAHGAPGMFRCADYHTLPNMFKKAGLKNVSIREVSGKMNCKTADVYWTVMTEVAAPVVAALSKADNLTRERIKLDVLQAVNQKFPEGSVQIGSSALIISGEK